MSNEFQEPINQDEFPDVGTGFTPVPDAARQQVTTLATIAYGSEVASKVDTDLQKGITSPNLKMAAQEFGGITDETTSDAIGQVLFTDKMDAMRKQAAVQYLLQQQPEAPVNSVEQDAVAITMATTPTIRDGDAEVRAKLQERNSVGYVNNWEQTGALVKSILNEEMPNWADQLKADEDERPSRNVEGVFDAAGAVIGGIGEGLGIIESMIPFSGNEVVLDVIEEAFPSVYDSMGIMDKVFLGEAAQRVQSELALLPPDQQVAKIGEVLDIVKRNAGFLNNNQTMAWMTVNTLFEDLLATGEEAADTSRLIDNAVSAMDLAGMGQLAKMTTSAGKVIMKSSTAGKLLEAAPTEVGEQLAKTITDPALDVQINKSLGVSTNETVSTVLPARDGDIVPDLPDTVREALKDTREEINRVKQFIGQGADDPIDVENLKIKESIANAVEGIEGYQIGKSTVKMDDDAMVVTATYGNSSGYGFTDPMTAIERMRERMPDVPAEAMEIVFKSPDGTVKPIFDTGAGIVQEALASITKTLTPQQKLLKEVNVVHTRANVIRKLIDHLQMKGSFAAPRGTVKKLRSELDTLIKRQEVLRENVTKLGKRTAAKAELKTVTPRIREIEETLRRNDALVQARADADRLRQGVVPANLEGQINETTARLLREQGAVEEAAQVSPWRAPVQTEVMDSNIPLAPEYFVRVKQTFAKDPVAEGIDEIVLGGFGEWGNESAGMIHRITRAIGLDGTRLSDYALLPESRFNAKVLDTTTAAVGTARGTYKRLQKLAARRFEKLSQDDQYKVARLLQDGNKEEKVFTPSELSTILPDNEAAVAAYYDMRVVYDALHNIISEAMDTKLAKAGYNMYAVGDDLTYFGRPLTNAIDVGTVYDPITRKIVKISQAALKEYMDNGGTVVRSQSRMIQGSTSTDYIKIPMENVRVGKPFNSVPYRKGYVPNVYKDNYFVRAHKQFIHNGKPEIKPVAIATAPDIATAERMAAELRRLDEYKGIPIKADRGRELKGHLDDDISELYDLIGSNNSPTGRRGAKLKGSGKEDNLENPLTAMDSVIQKVTKHAVLDPVIDSMQDSILEAYGQFLKVNPDTGKPVLPRSVADFREDVPVSKKIMNVAMEKQRYLDTQISMRDGTFQRLYKEAVLNLAESVAPYSSTASQLVLAGYKKDPLKLLTSPAFIVQLGLNITRQWLVQGSQIIFLAGSYNPAKLFSDTSGVVIARTAMLANNDTMLKYGAKLMGLTNDQAKEYVHAMNLSGILSVDSLSHSQDALRQMGKLWVDPNTTKGVRVAKRAGNIAARAITAVPRAATKVGFEAAEDLSISMHWAVAFRNWQKKTGKAFPSTAEWQDVAAETRRISLNFTRTGEGAYQKGMLRPMFQYLSFQHKAFAASMPVALGGSKQFSAQEKVRRSISQFLMFGAGGVIGGQWLYDMAAKSIGTPIPEPVKEVMDGLIMDTAFNYVMSAATGEEQNLDLSKDLAPLGGIEGAGSNLVAAVWKNPSLVAFMGPSANAYSRIYNAVMDAYNVMQIPTMDTKEQVLLAMENILRIAPQYDNATKLMLYKNAGSFINKHFEPIDAATTLESFAEGLFGLQTKEMSSYYELSSDVYGAYDPNRNMSQVDQIVEDYYRRWTKQATSVFAAPAESWDEYRSVALDNWQRDENAVLAMLDPAMRGAVQRKLFDKFSQDPQNPVNKLVSDLAEKVMAGTDVRDVREAISKASKVGEWNDVNTEILMNLYNTLLNKEERGE